MAFGFFSKNMLLCKIMFHFLTIFTSLQVTSDPDNFPEGHEAAQHVRIEYVVAVEGTVHLRPKEVANARMATGSVEVMYWVMGLGFKVFFD
jgi:aspartyl-tRNA synthetase